jgi:hypothetical protein
MLRVVNGWCVLSIGGVLLKRGVLSMGSVVDG